MTEFEHNEMLSARGHITQTDQLGSMHRQICSMFKLFKEILFYYILVYFIYFILCFNLLLLILFYFFYFIMVALCNRADHYIFILFLSSSSSSFFFFLFFPRLISAVGDWMFTILWHMVWP